MPPADRHRPIIFTDDASVLSVNEPPLSLDRIREQMIEPLEGTPASLWWSVGDHEVFHHETEIGEIIGDGIDDFEDYEYFHSFSAAQFKRVSDNTRHLMETTGGPLTTLIEMCREAGIEFFPRVRMNSHYLKDPSSPTTAVSPGAPGSADRAPRGVHPGRQPRVEHQDRPQLRLS